MTTTARPGRVTRSVARQRETARQTAFRPSDLAKRWDVSTPLIYRLLNSGGIIGFKVGGSWRISEEDEVELCLLIQGVGQIRVPIDRRDPLFPDRP